MVKKMNIIELVIQALLFIFPAYCANALPVIVGGGVSLDFGKSFIDGRPIFGRNKTFRGFFAGLAIGTLIGFLESFVFGYPILLGLLLSLGALCGDLSGAFLKRRIGLAPGDLLPIVDQIDFVVGAILFSLPLSSQFMSWELAVTVLLVTPPLHLLTNFVAYKIGLKKNPW
jgi:CDP-2,3-bis-(O-geranylgeranyl)-sn-glycerol synthase